MAQIGLRGGEAHGGCADARYPRSRARAGSPGRDPVRQFDRARADDAGCDAGAASGGAGIAGLFADEPGPRQAEISVRSDQAGAGDGAGRPGVREGLEGARSRRRHRHPCCPPVRGHQEHRLCRSRRNAGHARCRTLDRKNYAGYGRQTAVHLGFDRNAQGRHQHAGHDVRQCRDDDAGSAPRSGCAAGHLSRLDAMESHHGRQCAVQPGADRGRYALHRRWPPDAGFDRGDAAQSARGLADLLRQRARRLRSARRCHGEGRRVVPQLFQEFRSDGLWGRQASRRSL